MADRAPADPDVHGPWIDIHAHPGACFVGGLRNTSPLVEALGGDRSDQAAVEIAEANITAASFSTVADLIVLGIGANGSPTAVRELDDAAAHADHDRQLAAMQALALSTDLDPVTKPADITRLHSERRSGYFTTCEGGDFIGTAVERIEQAQTSGAVSITLVHYRVNGLGDIQTEDPVHGGLTDLGREVISEMNHRGMIIDLAHATQQTTHDAATNSTAPIIISHSHLAATGASHPRLLSAEHAAIIADSGGVVGAWPSGVVSSTFDDYVDEICRLIDVIGIDHVAIGTDMDANYKPVLTRYAQFGALADKLASRGLSRSELDGVMGTNFLRVWELVHSLRSGPGPVGK